MRTTDQYQKEFGKPPNPTHVAQYHGDATEASKTVGVKVSHGDCHVFTDMREGGPHMVFCPYCGYEILYPSQAEW